MEKSKKETQECFIHRLRCKHRGYSGSCLKKSGYYGPALHLNIACTADSECERLKRYDKKHEPQNK